MRIGSVYTWAVKPDQVNTCKRFTNRVMQSPEVLINWSLQRRSERTLKEELQPHGTTSEGEVLCLVCLGECVLPR